MIRALGGQIKKLRLSVTGAELHMNRTLSYGREFICALAGPLVNVIAAVVAARIGSEVFAGINLALAFFNLLPVSVLDGGRALSCLVSFILDPNAAQRLGAWVDRIVSVVLVLGGTALFGTGGNVTLLIVSVWLIRAFYDDRGKLCGKRGCQGAVERVK